MGLKKDLETAVGNTFRESWTIKNVQDASSLDSLALIGNDAATIDAVILYADLAGSTKLVDTIESYIASEIYKTFLMCCARIIRSEGGSITAYDGDRIMAVFTGDSKNTNACRTALKINYAMLYIIRPLFAARYPSSAAIYTPTHAVGIDASQLRVAKVGVKYDNDLVWVGRAANHAAKLCDIRELGIHTYISQAVYNRIRDEVKFSNGNPMWTERQWTQMNNKTIYSSTWYWSLD